MKIMNEAVAWELVCLDNALYLRDSHHSEKERERAKQDIERKLRGPNAEVIKIMLDLHEKGLSQRTFDEARKYLDNRR